MYTLPDVELAALANRHNINVLVDLNGCAPPIFFAEKGVWMATVGTPYKPGFSVSDTLRHAEAFD